MTDTLTLTERTRNALENEAQSLRLYAWDMEQALMSAEISDVDYFLRRIIRMQEQLKDIDRKVKARRRAAAKAERVSPV